MADSYNYTLVLRGGTAYKDSTAGEVINLSDAFSGALTVSGDGTTESPYVWTMTNFNFTTSSATAIKTEGTSAITIDVTGTNTITGGDAYYSTYGMNISTDTTFTGTGTLTVNAGNSSGSGDSTGVELYSGTLTVSDVAVTFNSGDAPIGSSYGMYGEASTVFSVEGTGQLKASAGNGGTRARGIFSLGDPAQGLVAKDGDGNTLHLVSPVYKDANDNPATTVVLTTPPAQITYLDANGNEVTTSEYTLVTASEDPVTWEAGVYVVGKDYNGDGVINYEDSTKTGKADVAINNIVTLKGDVTLIVADGFTLFVNDCSGFETKSGISSAPGRAYSLTVTSQSIGEDMGNLYVEGGDADATNSINAGSAIKDVELIVNGGYLDLSGGSACCLSSGGTYGDAASGIEGGSLTLNNGEMNIYGGASGDFSSGSASPAIRNASVTINGGELSAHSGAVTHSEEDVSAISGTDDHTFTFNGGTAHIHSNDITAPAFKVTLTNVTAGDDQTIYGRANLEKYYREISADDVNTIPDVKILNEPGVKHNLTSTSATEGGGVHFVRGTEEDEQYSLSHAVKNTVLRYEAKEVEGYYCTGITINGVSAEKIYDGNLFLMPGSDVSAVATYAKYTDRLGEVTTTDALNDETPITANGEGSDGPENGGYANVISGGTLTNADGKVITFKNSSVSNDNYGGAIYAGADGTVNFENAVFDSNSASYGGAVYAEDGSQITFTGSTFTGNKGRGGGAISTDSKGTTTVATINNSTFTGNTAVNDGGAINSHSSDLNVNGGTFTENTAIGTNESVGGAIYQGGGDLTINGGTAQVVFSGNRSQTSGGAIYVSAGDGDQTTIASAIFESNVSGYNGGAIKHGEGDSLTISDSTFTGNTAELDGGAVYLEQVLNATITGTTFSGNSAKEYGGAICTYCSGSSTSDYVLNLGDVTFDGNTAGEEGGAVYNHMYTVNLTGEVTLTTASDTWVNKGHAANSYSETKYAVTNWDLTGETAGVLNGYQYFSNKGEAEKQTITVKAEDVAGTASYVIATGDFTDVAGKDTFILTGVAGQTDHQITIGSANSYNGKKYTLTVDDNDKLVLKAVAFDQRQTISTTVTESDKSYVSDSSMGAMFVSSTGSYTGTNVSFNGNSASYGAAVGTDGGIFSLENGVFCNNKASMYGAAVNNTNNASVVFDSVSFIGNTADTAGAINNEAAITFKGTNVFSGNTATNTSADKGGAIFNGGTITLAGVVTLATETDTWVNCANKSVTWDLTEAATGDSVRIDNFQYVTNDTTTTQYIKVNADQAIGEYVIATGDFSSTTNKDTFTLTGVGGAEETITIAMNASYGGRSYSLSVDDNGTTEIKDDDKLVLTCGVDYVNLYISGSEIRKESSVGDVITTLEGLSWDSDTSSWIMEDFQFASSNGIVFADTDPVTITVKGTNSVISTGSNALSFGGGVTFNGDGTLAAKSSNNPTIMTDGFLALEGDVTITTAGTTGIPGVIAGQQPSAIAKKGDEFLTYDSASTTFVDSEGNVVSRLTLTAADPRTVVDSANPFALEADKTYTALQTDQEGGAFCVEEDGTLTGPAAGTVSFAGNNSTADNSGSAIFNKGTVTITGDAEFTDNRAKSTESGNGAAIYNDETGTVEIDGNATFSGNSAYAGGAIYNNGGTMTLKNAIFEDNTAENGAAIYNAGGTVTLKDVVFDGNVAGNSSYSICNEKGEDGSIGIINFTGTVTLNTDDDKIINNGSILNWDLTGGLDSYGSVRNGENSIEGINNICNDDGKLTITVSESQEAGIYVIGTGIVEDTSLEEFTLTGIDGLDDVTLTVNGSMAFEYGANRYALVTSLDEALSEYGYGELWLIAEIGGPSISITTEAGWFNKESQEITIAGTVKSEDSTITSFVMTGLGSEPITITPDAQGNWSYTYTGEDTDTLLTFTATDANGQESAASFQLQVDRVSPAVDNTAFAGDTKYVDTATGKTWFKKDDTTAALNSVITDETSGLDKVTYNGIAYDETGSKFVISTASEVNVAAQNIQVSDKAGNTNNTVAVGAYGVDGTEPTVENCQFTGNSKYVDSVNSKIWFKMGDTTAALTAEISDSGSGLNVATYNDFVYDAAAGKFVIDTTAEVSVEAKTITATDNVGNAVTSAAQSAYSVDGQGPTISVSHDPTTEGATSVTVTAEFADTGSGLVSGSQQYSYDGITYQDYTGSFVVTQGGTIYFKAQDNVGNETIEAYEITNIDTEPPVITIDADTITVKEEMPFSVTATDTQSGVTKLEYSTDGGETWTTCSGTGKSVTVDLTSTVNKTTYLFRATDKGSHVSTESVTFYNIYKGTEDTYEIIGEKDVIPERPIDTEKLTLTPESFMTVEEGGTVDSDSLELNGDTSVFNNGTIRVKTMTATNTENTLSGDAFTAEKITVAENADLGMSKDQYDSFIALSEFTDDSKGTLIVSQSTGNELRTDDIDKLMDKKNVTDVRFLQDLVDINKLYITSTKATTISFFEGYGTDDSDIIRFARNTNLVFGQAGREIDLAEGRNAVQIDKNATTIIKANLTNVSKVTAAAGSTVELADVDFQNGRKASLKAKGSAFTVGNVTGPEDQCGAIAIGKGTAFTADVMTLGAKNDKIAVGKNGAFKVTELLFGDGNDALKIGNATDADITSLDFGEGNDALKIGNATDADIATLDFGAGNDALKIGKYADVDISSLDFGEGTKDKLSIGKGAVVSVESLDVAGLDALSMGKGSLLYLGEDSYNAALETEWGQKYSAQISLLA